MSERKDFYDRLTNGMHGHYHKEKQTRIDKALLLELLFTRMDIREKGLNSLANAYLKKYGGKKTGFNAAMRSAINMLKKWFDCYYELNPDLPIKFLINDDYVLETIVNDGIAGKSIEELNLKIDALMEELGDCYDTISDIRAGNQKPKHADQLANRFNCMEKFASKLNKLSAAARRRT